MKSKQMNEALRKLADDESIGYDALGGKAVAYIGWYWREIDFDAKECYSIGIVPPFKTLMESNDRPRVGFMAGSRDTSRFRSRFRRLS